MAKVRRIAASCSIILIGGLSVDQNRTMWTNVGEVAQRMLGEFWHRGKLRVDSCDTPVAASIVSQAVKSEVRPLYPL